MSTWTVQTDLTMSSITARHNSADRSSPPDRYEDRGDWRVFFDDKHVVAVRSDSAFHRRLDLAPIVGVVPANVIAELRRVADGLLRNPADVSVSIRAAD